MSTHYHVHPLSCPPSIIFTEYHVHQISCAPSIMSTKYHDHLVSCPPSIMSSQHHVHPVSCPPSIMSTQHHVHPASCQPKIVFTNGHTPTASGKFYASSSVVAHACSLQEQEDFFYAPIPREFEAGQAALIPCAITGVPSPEKHIERLELFD